MKRIIRNENLTDEEASKYKIVRDEIAMEFPKRIEIKFPEHVQAWTVTPHGGELAGTARRVPETLPVIPEPPKVQNNPEAACERCK